MKLTDTLTSLFEQHLWANLRLLECCAGLTAQQLEVLTPGAFGRIQETLEHIVTSEQTYISRIITGRKYHHPDDAPLMTMQEIAEAMRANGLGLIEWGPKVQTTDMVEIDWDGTPRPVPKTILVSQVLTHAAEHREQIKAMLTEAGVEPPDLQSWAYFDEMDR